MAYAIKEGTKKVSDFFKEPKQLPVYKIKGKLYFRDVRLGEYRNIDNPSDSIPIDDVRLEDLEKPTKEDRKKVFGE